MRVFLGLGTNVGDRDGNLVVARDLLMKHDVMVVGQSKVRETKPLGGKNQPDYLNQVVECSTDLSPQELLKVCKMIEKEMGRDVKVPGMSNVSFGAKAVGTDMMIREKKWESRIIDIDILLYGDLVLNSIDLTIPHYDIKNRDFVIEGLRDIDSCLIIDVSILLS